jgi:hypothetical protein
MEQHAAPAPRVVHVGSADAAMVAKGAPSPTDDGNVARRHVGRRVGAGEPEPEEQITWAEAVARAKRLLAAERASGTSLSPTYCGGRPIQAVAIRPGSVGWPLKALQHLLGVAWIGASFWACRLLGFGVVGQVGFGLGGVNIFCKGLANSGGQFERDDAPVFMLMRALSPEARARAGTHQHPKAIARFFGPLTLLAAPCMMGWSALPWVVYPLAAGHTTFELWEHATIGYFCLYPMLPLCPGFITLYFGTTAAELTRAIDEFKLWSEEPPPLTTLAAPANKDNDTTHRRVDFREAYRNYDLMKQALEGFTESWCWFFFVAEFFVFLAMVPLGASAWDEARRYSALDEGSSEKTLCAWRAIMCANTTLVSVCIIWSLASTAGTITGAAQQVLPRAHALCMRIAVHCPSQLEEARLFYDLLAAEEHKIGFAFLGIVISPSFVAKGTYAAVSLSVAAFTILLEMRNQGVV